LLGKEGVYIDARYYCPHHPDSGFPGEVKELKIKCNCRKPNIGMIEKAVADYNLDLSKCVMIGDTDLDILTGKNANITTIRVTTGKVEAIKTEADYTFDNLYDAVKFVIGEDNKYEK
jgi:HAD superfamily hydrolase (TIGR01662 family)